jgi:hypothetical protein
MPSRDDADHTVSFGVSFIDDFMNRRSSGCENIMFDLETLCSCNDLRASECPSQLQLLYHSEVASFSDGIEHVL